MESSNELAPPDGQPFMPWAGGMLNAVYEEYEARRKEGKDPRNVLSKLPSKLRDKFDTCKSMWESVKAKRGKRYENCRFDSYEIKHEGQKQILEKLKEYSENSAKEIASGKNVILFGPKGTGKDHLLMALGYACCVWSGCRTLWINGVDLYEEFQRDATGQPSKHFRLMLSDKDMPENVDVMMISDPLPPSGVLSEFQQKALFQLIDTRYSNMLPTWVTLNVANGAEAEARMGAQVVDRLRHGALQCFCNWPSFRTESSQ